MQDDASTGIQSLQTSIEIKLCQNPWNGLCSLRKTVGKVSPILVTLTSRSDSDFRTFERQPQRK